MDTAQPGSAWEAIRLDSSRGDHTCSLYVGVAELDAAPFDEVRPGATANADAEPRWERTDKRPVLYFPDPALRLPEDSETWSQVEREVSTRSCDPGSSSELVQVWACAQARTTTEPQPFEPHGYRRVVVPEPEPGETWGTTVPAGEMNQARHGFTATLLADGRVLVAGGHSASGGTGAELWDPASQAFAPVGQMQQARTGHTAVPQPDGSVLFVGGNGRFGAHLKNAELWDPATSEFRSVGRLRTPRLSTASVTTFPDGHALIVGGNRVDRQGPALRAEVWNPGANRFEAAGTLDSPRNGHRAFALPDGDAMITGPGNREWLRWDSRKRDFETAGQPEERRAETHQLKGGRLLSVGVNDPMTCKKGKAYASTPDADIWLPGPETFRRAGAFKWPRYKATVTPLPDGGALFYGGGIATCKDSTTYPTAEYWDPGTRTFRRAGRTELPRVDEATALLPDGRVAVIGGIGTHDYSCPDAVLGSIELWDPSTRSFAMAGKLEVPRAEATALVLDDGSVLILGGIDRADEPVAAAELWRPPPATD